MPLPYTPEFLESLRHRYEETSESLEQIGAEFRLDPQTVSRIARREGWRMRSAVRHLPAHVRLADDARRAKVNNPSSARPRESGDPEAVPVALDSRWSLSSGEPKARPEDGNERDKESELPAFDRIEQLVLREIAIEEARRTEPGSARKPAETVHKARALGSLLQTLQAIRQEREGGPALPAGRADDNSDDMPKDIDEFRIALARRIDAFVESRADAGNAEAGGTRPVVDETG